MGDAGEKSMSSVPVDLFNSLETASGNWVDPFHLTEIDHSDWSPHVVFTSCPRSLERLYHKRGCDSEEFFRKVLETLGRKRVQNLADCVETVDGKRALDLVDLQNPETVFAWVDNASTSFWGENKELQVKVPIEYVSCIGALKQRGFDKIVQIAPTYIVLKKGKACTGSTKTKTLCIKKLDKLARRLAPTSNVNAVVPRGNIASSSNPHNLICSQTPVATLAVQTPSESAGEQFHQLQHSSPAFPSGPVGMGNDNEGAGLECFSAGQNVPECGVPTKKRPHHGPDFESKEMGLVLKYKSDFLKDPANAAKRSKWSTFVSDNMIKDQGPWRTPLAVRTQWDNFMKVRNAVLKFTPPNTNYWDLTMDEKRAIRKENPNLPLRFDYEWFLTMEDIDKMEGRTAAKKETRRDGQEGVFSQLLASTITGSANFAGTDCLEMPGNEPDSETEAMDVPTDEEVLSDESGASLESHTDMATVDSHGPRSEPSRKRSAASAYDEDSQLAKIGPFVNQQIHEALLPWINALQSREEDEHKHRQKMLAIEQEKLALMRQKMECIRRFNAVPASVAKWRGKPPSL